MGLFNKLFSKDQPKAEAPTVTEKKETLSPPKAKKPQEKKPKKSPKELATEKGEPYVNIISVELDPENIGNGAFELDWNDFFVAKLVRSGYKGKDDSQIVDQWFQDVCRNVVMETFEQYEANNPRPVTGVQRKDLGGGRSEVS
jgi:hypothetical protein